MNNSKLEISKIWNQLVSNVIVQESKSLKIKHKPLFFIRLLVFFHYRRLRKKIVVNYMTDDTENIDRHKVASCVMKSILLAKPLYIPLKMKIKFLFSSQKNMCEVIKPNFISGCSEEDIDDKEKFYTYLNEYLAVFIAVSILDSYIFADDKKFHHKIVAPQPFPEPDIDYLLDVCIGLGYSSLKKCNPITYANIFFLWEKYSCRKKRCDNLSEAYKTLLIKYRQLANESELSDEELNKEVDIAMYAEQADRILKYNSL